MEFIFINDKPYEFHINPSTISTCPVLQNDKTLHNRILWIKRLYRKGSTKREID
ncbi:hypothetical protein [Barnesiella intestinihominis]|uniref:hypothetical protein n=1 Tax=Barnesiella intestinihominis TaxID=487174 RepID=UPI0039674B92